jgi:hypothetical protein
MNNKFEVLICCYGNYYDISKKCIDSILQHKTLPLKIHVGLSECCNETKKYYRHLLDTAQISSLIDCNVNINKDPMFRMLLDLVDTEYMIWFDDDSYIRKPNWDQTLNEQIQNHPVDVLGFPHVNGRNALYIDFLKSRSWYKGIKHPTQPSTCFFPVGGLWVGRCEYLRKYDYPDRNMIKRNGDMLLGDLLLQTSGTFHTLFGWEDTFMVNKAERRGNGEYGFKNFKGYSK